MIAGFLLVLRCILVSPLLIKREIRAFLPRQPKYRWLTQLNYPTKGAKIA